MKKLLLLCCLVLLPLLSLDASAAQIRVYVNDMTAIGAANRDEMRMTLQSLLSSRLSGDKLIAVASAAEADVLLTGTYVAIGKIYSIDVMAKGTGGRTLTRVFVQSETPDDLIPLIGKLAEKLSSDLVKLQSDGALETTVLNQPRRGASDVIRQSQGGSVRRTEGGDIIRQEKQRVRSNASGEKGWISKRLPGAANVMDVGTTLPDGSRELFLAQDYKMQYFSQGEVLKLMATVEVKANEKIISVDAADADGDGKLEVYVTVIKNGELASQIWEVRNGKLARIADDLPYYFHAIAMGGGAKKLYLQEMSADDDFYGPLYEATRSGAKISKKNPIKLPRYANIYNYNQFKDRDGYAFSVALNENNYLVVFNKELKEVWRSSDKFGGSALFFEREDLKNARVTGQKFRQVNLYTRIHVTAKNEVIVGKNDGTFVVGNSRLYKKGAVHCFEWDDSSLDEIWRTREVQNYMPDYWYDEARSELLLLQMPLKPGFMEEGAASLAIKKVE